MLSRTKLNPTYETQLYSKLVSASSGIFACKIKIFNPDNPSTPEYVVEPDKFEQLSVIQDFKNAYGDIILLDVKLHPQQFQLVYESRENLYVSIETYPVSEDLRTPDYGISNTQQNTTAKNLLKSTINNYTKGFTSLLTGSTTTGTNADRSKSQEGLNHTYKAVIVGQNEVEKSVAPEQITQTENNEGTDLTNTVKIDVQLQLVDEDLYNKRTQQFSLQLLNSTVTTALNAAANTLGITNIIMSPADNNAVYPQITFPPGQTLESFIPLLQKECGIYQRDVSYYYTNKTLYVYPKNDPHPEGKNYEEPVNIYKAPKDHFPGLFGYHATFNDGSLHIVSDTDIEVETLSPLGIENNGTAQISTDANKQLDSSKTMTGSQGVFNTQQFIRVGVENETGNTDGQKVINMKPSTQNPYDMSSSLSLTNCTSVSLGWINPVPFIIQPGQQCVFHYVNKDNQYKTQVGIIEGVSYIFTINSRPADYYYKGGASLQLRLASDSEKIIDSGESAQESSSPLSSIKSIFSKF